MTFIKWQLVFCDSFFFKKQTELVYFALQTVIHQLYIIAAIPRCFYGIIFW